jgi:hypothetical protein
MAGSATAEKTPAEKASKKAKAEKEEVSPILPSIDDKDQDEVADLALEYLNSGHVQTITDVKAWWKHFFGKLGHKKLGRMLIGTYKPEE